jgi:hypothetical protein
MKKILPTILFFLLFLPGVARAIDKPTFQITIPTINLTDIAACPDDAKTLCIPWIGEYIIGVYNYALGIAGILAAIVIMWGGIVWVTAGGNQQKIGEAKKYIAGSITGLILLLASYTVLYFINPDLTVFKSIRLSQIEKKDIISDDTEIPAEVNPYARYTNCTWENTESNQKKLGKDDLCTPPKPTGKECYCNISPIAGCTYRAATCQADEEKRINGTSPYHSDCGTDEHYLGKYCCCKKVVSGWIYDSGVENQKTDASSDLINLLNCMRPKLNAGVGRISSISDSNYIGRVNECYTGRGTNTCKTKSPSCVHTCSSCHYGSGLNTNKSYAVDFGDEQNATALKKAAQECGAGYILNEGNHLHVSAAVCPGN